jgi:uncharacterized protein
VIVADTSGLLALYNRAEPFHARVSSVVAASEQPLVVSPFVIAELDYLITTRIGPAIAVAVAREIAGGAYEVAGIDETDLASCADIMERYIDHPIGVTDASIVVLSRRYRTRRLLTLDHRHFSVVRPLDGGRFTLLPT